MKISKGALALAAIIATVVAVGLITPASGGGPSLSKVAKQVKSLKKQFKKLSKQPGPQGQQGQQGPAGTAKGYAHVFANGTLDAANSLNVTAAAAGPNGEYCINAVGFTPKSITATIDQGGVSLIKDRTLDAGLGGYGSCSTILPGTDSFIRTHSGAGTFVSTGFFVVLN